MKTTYMAKTEEIQRKWYVLDATDKPLGRLAAEAAHILRGKHKPTFTPHVDTGDFVIVVNAEKAILTGNKLQNKLFRYHTGYPGGLKSIKYEDLMSKKPEQAIEKAITGMLPHNRLGAQTVKKLKVYQGEKHPHEAQKPEVWNF